MQIPPRYSVCAPTLPHPTELKAINHRTAALELSATIPGSVVYDWSIPGIINAAGDQIMKATQ